MKEKKSITEMLGRGVSVFLLIAAMLVPAVFTGCTGDDVQTNEPEKTGAVTTEQTETQTQIHTEAPVQTEPITEEEIMDDNIESKNPAYVGMFDTTDSASHSPIPISKSIGMYYKVNAPFNGITVGFPTWGAVNAYCSVSLYKWNTDYKTTIADEPLFKTKVTELADCAFRAVPFSKEFESGEYLVLLDDAGGDNKAKPGVWKYESDVSKGQYYYNGRKESGEMQAWLQFTVTPYIPFGSLESLYIISATEEEKASAEKAYRELLKNLKTFPASFCIGDTEYHGFGGDFELTDTKVSKTDNSETTTFTLRHTSGIDISLICTVYPNYAAYEWTIYFSNNTDSKSPRISEINGCDYVIAGGNPHLKGIYGDGGYDGEYYKPYDINFSGMKLEINNETGRATYNRFPYFNIAHSAGGVFFAVGWSGQWRAGFEHSNGKIRVTDGQVSLDTYLLPGQSIRTPLSCFMFYNGTNQNRAMNLWRNFFYDCNMRQVDGGQFSPALAACTSWMYAEMVGANEKNQIDSIKKYHDNGVNLDYWWMDAGWYYKKGTEKLDTWLTTGSWRVDEKRFPTKFKAITEYANSVGTKTLLWFEPEVVRDVSVLDEYSVKKEWILPKSGTKLVDIGNPEARAWLLDRVSTVLTEGGISLYRQDYGVAYPASEWAANDPTGQTGITENLYVQGYLAFFDGLIERFPDMMIDSCAAGGGRNDLETMRRGVPLHKSDSGYSEHDMKQEMNYSLFAWLPYFGTVTNGPDTCSKADKYALRSSYCSFPVLEYNLNVSNLDWKIVSECMDEWEKIKDFYNDDYYPLTEWNNSDTEWTAWEFYDPEQGAGFAEVFRPEKSEASQFTLKLYGMKNSGVYRLTDAEGLIDVTVNGYELKTKGITITLPERSSDVIYISEAK